jgi:protein subunit release factor B
MIKRYVKKQALLDRQRMETREIERERERNEERDIERIHFASSTQIHTRC